MAVYDNQRGPFVFPNRRGKGLFQLLTIIGVADALHVPMIPHETRRHVVAERQSRIALNGNAIVVVDPDEIAETQMPSQRRRLTGDAFHHAAIPAQRHDVVRDDLVPWTIVVRAQPAARHGHADTGGHTLSQWPSGRLDTRCQRVIWCTFGVSRT